jgi:hypothetical protein
VVSKPPPHVKLTFARGPQLRDPSALFNSSLDGKARRALDIHEGEGADETAFKTLIREAVKRNTTGPVHFEPAAVATDAEER